MIAKLNHARGPTCSPVAPDPGEPARPFLDYYTAHKIVPVKQDLSDLAAHFYRRRFLYHSLHISGGNVQGRRVMEIGPGAGDNAIYTASLGPDTYVFVDGNPYSIKLLRERLADSQYPFGSIRYLEAVEADFITYEDSRHYDIVLCEGVIHGQKDATAFLRKAASFTDRHGIVVATTQSATSILSEICRRLVKPVLARQTNSREELRQKLVALFTPDLETLPGRSRLVGDWIDDTILFRWNAYMVFTIHDAIDAIGDEFDVYGTSPRFIQDFRWYKAPSVDGISINQMSADQVALWSPIFLDYRADPAEFRGFDGRALERECHAIMMQSFVAWDSDNPAKVADCVKRVVELGERVAAVFPGTARSIRDFASGMTMLLAGDTPDFGEFRSWFGRGQQYVSFLRR